MLWHATGACYEIVLHVTMHRDLNAQTKVFAYYS